MRETLFSYSTCSRSRRRLKQQTAGTKAHAKPVEVIWSAERVAHTEGHPRAVQVRTTVSSLVDSTRDCYNDQRILLVIPGASAACPIFLHSLRIKRLARVASDSRDNKRTNFAWKALIKTPTLAPRVRRATSGLYHTLFSNERPRINPHDLCVSGSDAITIIRVCWTYYPTGTR